MDRHVSYILLLFSSMLIGLLCFPIQAREGLPRNISIGVLFEETQGDERKLLKEAIKKVQRDTSLLPHTELIVHWERIGFTDPYDMIEQACRIYGKSPSLMITLTSCQPSTLLQNAANVFRLPHLQIATETCRISSEFTLSMNPDVYMTDMALFSLIKLQEWTSFVVYYDTDMAYHRVQSIIESADNGNLVWEVILLRYIGDEVGTRWTSQQLKRMDGIHNYVVVFETKNVFNLLRTAGNMGMRSREYHWIVLYQGMTDTQLENVPKALGIVIFVRQQPLIIETNEEEVRGHKKKKKDRINNASIPSLYLHDSVIVAAMALDAVIKKHRHFIWPAVDPSLCRPLQSDTTVHHIGRSDTIGSQEVTDRYALMDAVRKVRFENGLSGTVDFDTGGYNERGQMEVISVSSTQYNVTDIARIGIWDPVNRLNMSHTPFQSTFKVLQNRTLKIVTIEEEPFVRKTEIRPGVYEYTGFCIDILDEISRKLQFTYVLYDVPDLKYGAKVNGTWNGLVGEVAYGKADMAVAGITIMAEREEVVDFTKPYYQYALGIIISKPRTERGIFAFMEPLSGPVWGCIAAALFVVGIFLFVIARLSPYSSFNYSKKEYCECKGDDFNLKNSYWFALASLMNQGGDTAPYSISGRLLSGFWWFFTLIIIATYTANLTAFLTVSRMETPISSVEELSTQSKIKYGTIRDSSVVSFFKRSTINPYQRMWQFMNTTEVDPYVDTVTDAYRRAKGEEYAFMWDYPVLELQKRIDCDLMTVGKPFYEKGYGFVTPQGADWRDDISMSILEMRENGQLEKYRKKTWEIESECEDDAAMIRSSTNEIDIQSVAGVFYILMIGAGVSLITVSVEILYYHFLRKCCRPTITVHPNVDGKAIEVREENAIEDGKSLSNSRV